jgi:hypothetical protein
VSRFKVGDLEPAVAIPLTERAADGTVTDVDLSTAVSVHVKGRRAVAFVIDDADPTIVGNVVTHEWNDGESDDAGRFWFRAVVTWPGGRQQTFPAMGELPWDIEP